MSITGVGAVTGYGWGKKHLWDGFLLGESAVKKTTGLDGYVDGGFAYISTIPDEGDRRDGPSRFMQALRFAAREAVSEALERGWEPGPVVGVVHSLVLGDVEMWSDFHRSTEKRVRARRWIHMMPSTVLSMTMKEFDFHGPAMSVTAMCASGNAGLITAKSWLDTGVASDVLLLATDLSGMPENLRPFSDLGVAVLDSPPFEACRPFQEGSRGFVGGEAAVAMVLSDRGRGAQANVLGGAMTMDAYHAVAMAPDLKEMFRCFTTALEVAGVDASEIAYMNAHGPGTAECDASEARVLDQLFPDAKGIFSVKPLTGHCQAAASLVETLATLYAFRTGFVPAPPQVAPGHPRLLDGLTPREPGLDDQVLDRVGWIQLGRRARGRGGLIPGWGAALGTTIPSRVGLLAGAPSPRWRNGYDRGHRWRSPAVKDRALACRYLSLWLDQGVPTAAAAPSRSTGSGGVRPTSQVRPSKLRRMSTSPVRGSRPSPGSTTRPPTRSSGRARSRSSSASNRASAASGSMRAPRSP